MLSHLKCPSRELRAVLRLPRNLHREAALCVAQAVAHTVFFTGYIQPCVPSLNHSFSLRSAKRLLLARADDSISPE
jgi:hypothetical protein